MAGITDRAFRRIAERYGAAWTVSEMIASAALVTGHREMVRKLRKSGRLPHVVQLAGCEPRWMRRGAQIASDAGADVIDINFGCPSKRVTNGFAGSALMLVPDMALRLFEAVAETSRLPVSVKMRLGWDDDHLNAGELARRCVDAGAAMIVVHARTRQQFYKGRARWNLVRPVVEAVNVPVVVNGDIVDAKSARAALGQSRADGVMIGRRAEGRPWIVGQVGAAMAGKSAPATPTGGALADLIEEHYQELLSDYGSELGVRVARKHIGWYLDAAGISSDKSVRHPVMTASDPALVIRLVREHLAAHLDLAA